MSTQPDILDEFDIPDLDEVLLPASISVSPELYYEVSEPLAVALAMELEDEATICARYGLSMEQLHRLREVPQFQELVKLHKASWEAADNTIERIGKKASMALEKALLPIAMIALDENTNDAIKIQAAKLLKEVSPVGQKDVVQQGEGTGVRIQINLNGTQHDLTFDRVVDGEVADAG